MAICHNFELQTNCLNIWCSAVKLVWPSSIVTTYLMFVRIVINHKIHPVFCVLTLSVGRQEGRQYPASVVPKGFLTDVSGGFGRNWINLCKNGPVKPKPKPKIVELCLAFAEEPVKSSGAAVLRLRQRGRQRALPLSCTETNRLETASVAPS